MGRLVDEVLERTGEKKRDRYHLMNKDVELCEFSLESGLYSVAKDIVIKSDLYSKMTLNINQFLLSRAPYKHREHIKKVVDLCGVSTLDGLIQLTKAASLNDTLWVKPHGSKHNWSDISLYQNDFDNIVARTAFDGGLYGETMSTTTPELSTNGQFPKCWVRDKDDIFLYKSGTKGAANAGLESFSEFLASQVLTELGLDGVKYDLLKFHGHLASSCKLFTSEQLGFIAYGNYFRDGVLSLGLALSNLEKIGLGSKFKDMIVFDSLIMNPDRHAGNFGLVINNDNFEVEDFAPIFDNNLSLNCYAMKDDFEDIDFYMKDTHKSHCAAPEGKFEEIGKELCSNEMKKKVRKLFDFEFKNHDIYPLPDWRIKELSKLVQRQAKFICS